MTLWRSSTERETTHLSLSADHGGEVYVRQLGVYLALHQRPSIIVFDVTVQPKQAHLEYTVLIFLQFQTRTSTANVVIAELYVIPYPIVTQKQD